MSEEREQAALLLERCRSKLSGPAIDDLEAIVDEGGIPLIWDDERDEWIEEEGIRDNLTRLCTEFAEHLK